jgi:mono/diheme cytochrome c family protein
MRSKNLTAFALCALVFTACRGGVSKSPPVHLVLDMDFQPKLRAQGESKFWKDSMAMRYAPIGTVARGTIKQGDLYDIGTAPNWVAANPVKPTAEVLARGQERYNINCAPCHDRTGAGLGLVAKRWPVAVPTFYDEAHANMPAGRIVNAITNGFNTMPSYANQVSWEDRWAIAHYVGALQYRMNAPK